MSILDFLRSAAPRAASSGDTAQTDTVRKVIAELDLVDAKRARHLAAFAYLLGRVAYADLDIQPEEVEAMESILRDKGGLEADQARLVVKIVKVRNELFGRTEDYLVAREFKEITTREQRLKLLSCLFAVAAADDIILPEEETVIRQIVSELGLTLREFTAARAPWNDKRSVFKQS